MTHRKPRSSRAARRAIRLSMLATAGLAVIAPATAADAAASGSNIPHDVATAVDEAHTLANRAHRTQYQDSFTVHQFGPLIAARAYNRAVASSVGCSLDDPCRSVALSFQIVTTGGENVRLNATNISRATDEHCDGCQTFAGAYQFIVSTPRPFTLSGRAQQELADLHQQLDELGQSRAPISVIKQRADVLAAQVLAILQQTAAAAPRGDAANPLQDFRPTVTLHRHVS